MKYFVYPLAALIIIMSLQLAFGAEYISGGVGAVRSINTSNNDKVEFGAEPWVSVNIAAGDDTLIPSPIDGLNLGAELELSIIPGMPQHGQNSGSDHRTADGQAVTMGSLMVNVQPSIPISNDLSTYAVAGVGVGYGASAGPAFQGGAGLRYSVTNDLAVDGSLRYRNVAGLAFAGPELRLVWGFPK